MRNSNVLKVELEPILKHVKRSQSRKNPRLRTNGFEFVF